MMYWKNSTTGNKGLKTYLKATLFLRQLESKQRTNRVFPVPTSPVITIKPFLRPTP